MKIGNLLVLRLLVVVLLAAPVSKLLADELTTTPSDTRYGLFNWLDHRSGYGQGIFPEPFVVDDSDLEVNEARLGWEHTDASNPKSDVNKAEIEKGFGLLTLELEVPYEIDTTSSPHSRTEAFDNINLGARYPIYQFVSDNKIVDTTFGTALEVGIPTHSSLSKDTEVVPKIFNDLKLGDHLTLQSVLGLSMLYGGDADNGLKTFEYGFSFGYMIPHEQLPLPDVLRFIPVFELSGETEVNKGSPGHNSLSGDAGFRFNLKAIGGIQPRLGVAYIFPIDNGARENMRGGVITSLVFEY